MDYTDRSASVANFQKRKMSELPGAKITAFASSLFQRVRLIDGINF